MQPSAGSDWSSSFNPWRSGHDANRDIQRHQPPGSAVERRDDTGICWHCANSTGERVDAAENPSAKDALLKNAVAAYVYLYPLAVFGRTMEVLTNVERPTWRKLSAPVNQLMSVRHNDPANHGVIVPSTDTLYSAVLADVTKEPLVLGVPAIPDIGPEQRQ